MIAGIGREATELIRETSTPLLFHHSRRVFCWASLQAERLGLGYDPELLYVGAMFHDVGLLEGHRSEHERALHTTRQAPNYLQPEVRLVALGVQYDILGADFDTQREAVLAVHPRTRFPTGMIEALSAGARDKPETAVGTFLTDILEATVPGYVRFDVCHAIRHTPFEA